MRNGSKVIAPVGCKSYLTAGKEYKITDIDRNGPVSFNIVDDLGSETFCLLEGCAHLYGKDWIIKNKK